MRTIHSRTPLPNCIRDHPEARGILLEKDIRIRKSRLRAKVIVFKTGLDMRMFWTRVLHKPPLGRYTRGAVQALYQEVYEVNEKGRTSNHRLKADPRYFCIIALRVDSLNRLVLAHEAGHAAIAYARRVNRQPWDPAAKNFDEEEICYPLGYLFQELCTAVQPLW